MSRSASPLRYPGGKACLYELATCFLSMNGLQQRNYVEPFSGGCGLALSLLFSGHVSHVYLNDIDRSVWAFWKTALDHTDRLVSLISSIEVTIEQWDRQRSVQSHKEDAEVLDLGFSTFFLNRTNRSGIIHSDGVIGGRAQAGDWKIDCRYNKSDLIKRIRRVARYRNRISIYNEDAELLLDRLGHCISKTSVIYVDPPYYEKGSQLYQNAYRPADHERIATRMSVVANPWFMTYDNVQPIRDLYSAYRSVELDIGYSVQTKRRGSELFLVSDGLCIPVDGPTVAH